MDRVSTTPTPSSETRAAAAGWGSGNWMDQHLAINAIGETRDPDVVFLGDSITQSLGGPGRRVSVAAGDIFDTYFPGLDVANFGISGDRTQHVLWRIDHGNFTHIKPHTVVLMIGTNNLQHDSADDVAVGIQTIVARLRQILPTSTILLCDVVRGASSDDPLRRKAARLNALIHELDDEDNIRLVTLEDYFYLPSGLADPSLMQGDFVHFSPMGYQKFAEVVSAAVRIQN